MNKLMEWVEEYERLEDNQLQDKAKLKAPIIKKKEVKVDQTLILKGLFLSGSEDKAWNVRRIYLYGLTCEIWSSQGDSTTT